MYRFFESDAVLENENVEKNRIAADYTCVRASQERGTKTRILRGHHYAHGCRVS